VEKFMRDAVALCNDRCFGTLTCAILISPHTQKRHQAAFQTALQDLRYGSITVNGPTHFSYVVTLLPWGGWAGAGTVHDMGSGKCVSFCLFFVHTTNSFRTLLRRCRGADGLAQARCTTSAAARAAFCFVLFFEHTTNAFRPTLSILLTATYFAIACQRLTACEPNALAGTGIRMQTRRAS
jgi:hypothetical protein